MCLESLVNDGQRDETCVHMLIPNSYIYVFGRIGGLADFEDSRGILVGAQRRRSNLWRTDHTVEIHLVQYQRIEIHYRTVLLHSRR